MAKLDYFDCVFYGIVTVVGIPLLIMGIPFAILGFMVYKLWQIIERKYGQ